jgi:hypothetical protein
MGFAPYQSRHRPLILLALCMIRIQAFQFVVAFSKRSLSVTTTCLLSGINNNSDETGINGDTNRSNNQREGKTGWQHNQPSENSPFWQSESSSSGDESRRSNDGESTSAPLRTGWLHNTAPARDITKTAAAAADQAAEPNKSQTPPDIARKRLNLAMKQQARNHEIHSVTLHAVGGKLPLVVTEHSIRVPLNRKNDTDKRTVTVTFSIAEKCTTDEERRWWEQLGSSSLSSAKRAQEYTLHAALANADDMIVYLQGGPGYGAPRPVSGLGLSAEGSWAGAALDSYKRVVLMDQRGTGGSSPVTKQSLQLMFPELFFLDSSQTTTTTTTTTTTKLDEMEESDQKRSVQTAVYQVVDYLAHFRADNIVQDAEEVKEVLLLPNLEETESIPKPWGASLGQSFGGFCSMTYLSMVEHPPRCMLFTGGIAPQLTPCYDVYCSLWDRVRERTLQYYDMYPGDVKIVKRIVRKLLEQPVGLPSGGKLTARRFLQLGLGLGGSPSQFTSLHHFISSAFLQTDQEDHQLEFRRSFLKQIELDQSFDEAPFYFWLHESIYGDGPGKATNWAAHRAYIDKCKESSDFDYTVTCSETDQRPVLFFGEMVFPWMSEDYAELQGVGLTAVAQGLAQKDNWDPLYNATAMQVALADKTRAAALVYYDDLYVDFDACMQVTRRGGGPLEQCKVWITNEYQHSGLRDDGAKIFTKLLGMARGSIRTPS